MQKRDKAREILERTGYVLDCIVLSILVIIAVGILVRTIRLETISVGRIRLHWYLAAGFLSFFVLFLIPRVRANTRWMMKFVHEFTHLVFALLFFRKIHRFKVDAEDSHVSYSGGWFGYLLITVAPYCVPLLTLALLPWRFTTGHLSYLYLAAIDIIIGFTYAFHVSCWVSQTRLYQTDITGPGVLKSLLTIVFFHIVNFCLVIQTPSSGVQNALVRVFWEFPRDFVLQALALFS